jgi:hypothetical protein
MQATRTNNNPNTLEEQLATLYPKTMYKHVESPFSQLRGGDMRIYL